MANGELCIHCQHQETTHKYPEYAEDPKRPPCHRFVSEVKHHKDCPIIGCEGGNCERTIERRRWSAICQEHWAANRWGFIPGRGIFFVDAGS